MSVTIEFGTFPVYGKDGMCQLRPPYQADIRLQEWKQVLQRAVDAPGSQARPAAAALLQPSFLAAMGSGYVIPAPFDCAVDLRNEDGKISIQHRMPPGIDQDLLEFWWPFPDGHKGNQIAGSPWETTEWIVKLKGFWYIKTPPGYSCLFVSPQLFSNENLPLYALPGLIETDVYKNLISFPMIPKIPFPLTIKAGTPLVHVFPFKRDDWSMVVERYESDTNGAQQ